MPDQDAGLYRAAHAREAHGHEEWIEGVLEAAAILHRKRNEIGDSDNAFGKWLVENGVKELHNDHDRAALINLGANLELAREVLQQTERTSLQYIWREEANARFAYVSKASADNEEVEMKAGGQKQRTLDLAKQAGGEGISSPEVAKELGIPAASASRGMSELKAEGLLVATNMTHGKSAVLVHRDFATEDLSPEDKKSKKKRRKLEPLNRYSRPLVPSTKVTPEEAGYPVDDPHGIDPETGLSKVIAYHRKFGHGTGIPLKTRLLMENNKDVVQVAPRMRDMTKFVETWTGICATAYLRTPKEQADPIVPMQPEKFMAAVRNPEVVSGARALRRVKEDGPKFLEAAAVFQAQLDQVVAHVKAIMAAVNEAPPTSETPPEGNVPADGAEIIELNSVRT